jgi:hypothetical protein
MSVGLQATLSVTPAKLLLPGAAAEDAAPVALEVAVALDDPPDALLPLLLVHAAIRPLPPTPRKAVAAPALRMDRRLG